MVCNGIMVYKCQPHLLAAMCIKLRYMFAQLVLFEAVCVCVCVCARARQVLPTMLASPIASNYPSMNGGHHWQ